MASPIVDDNPDVDTVNRIDAVEFLRFRAELDSLIEDSGMPDWQRDVLVDAGRYLDILSNKRWRVE